MKTMGEGKILERKFTEARGYTNPCDENPFFAEASSWRFSAERTVDSPEIRLTRPLMARYYQCHRNPYRRPTWQPRFPHCAIGNASSLRSLAQTRPQPLHFDKDDACTGDRIESLIACVNNGRASSSVRLSQKVNCCCDHQPACLCRFNTLRRCWFSPPVISN